MEVYIYIDIMRMICISNITVIVMEYINITVNCIISIIVSNSSIET
jgi:hypothetical protein